MPKHDVLSVLVCSPQSFFSRIPPQMIVSHLRINAFLLTNLLVITLVYFYSWKIRAKLLFQELVQALLHLYSTVLIS